MTPESAGMNKLFDQAELECLRALLDAIIPADDFPSAWEAGVGDYLQRQLAGDLAKALPDYRAWLAQLTAEARAHYGRGFAQLRLSERTGLLRRIEADEVQTQWAIAPGGFFREIVEACAEGYYSDPGNGGNRDGIAWRMVGFEVTA